MATPKNDDIFLCVLDIFYEIQLDFMRYKIGYLGLNIGALDTPDISALKRCFERISLQNIVRFKKFLVENIKLIPSLNVNQEWFEGFSNFIYEMEYNFAR